VVKSQTEESESDDGKHKDKCKERWRKWGSINLFNKGKISSFLAVKFKMATKHFHKVKGKDGYGKYNIDLSLLNQMK